MANITLRGYGENDNNIVQSQINTEEILVSRLLRDKYASQVDVLDKVKKLSMLPDDVHVTVEMAANYYVVEPNTVKQLIHYHKDEFLQDGLKVVRGKELQELKAAWLGNLTNLKFAQQLTLIPRRVSFASACYSGIARWLKL